MQALRQYGHRMSTELKMLVQQHLESRGGGDGWYLTAIDGLHLVRLSENLPSSGSIYKPSLCITLQGAKQVAIGDDLFDYGELSFLLVAVDLPALERLTEASAERPYIGLTIEIDVAQLRAVMDELEDPPRPAADDTGVFTAPLDGGLADAVLRLVRLLDQPKAAPILTSAIMRELSYWLLTGPFGAQVCRTVLPHTHLHRVAEAILHLRENFARPVRMEELAGTARMGLSSFHQHFTTVTSMTPLQYQKRLRLLEARRLMMAEEVNVSAAAFDVGYESVSQFSREYRRMFGASPRRDLQQLKLVLPQLATPFASRDAGEVPLASAA